MPESAAQSSSVPESPYVCDEITLPEGKNTNSGELRRCSSSTADRGNSQSASARPSLPRSASPALPESSEPQTSPSSSQPRLPQNLARSSAKEPNLSSTEPTTGNTPSQSLDAHNRRIIAASATLAFLQNKGYWSKSLADPTYDSKNSKVKALTILCQGMLRKPDETFAISADVFQSEILLVVAHDDGSPIPPETGMKKEGQPRK